MKRAWRACINSWNGLRFAIRSEAAFREELVALLLAVPFAFLIAASASRAVMMILSVVLVLTVELLNTAIEKLADRVTREQDPQVKAVKDLGSAAVAGTLLIAGATWLFAIAERMGIL